MGTEEKDETRITQLVADVKLTCPQDGFLGSTVVYLTPKHQNLNNDV